MKIFKILSGLNSNDKIYRYMSLSSFLYLLEFKSLVFTKIIEWDDSWELPSSKLPVINVSGKEIEEEQSISDELFAQSWTLNNYSDAMWRIYSEKMEGIMIGTSVNKFNNISNLYIGFIGKVLYYKHLVDGVKEITDKNELPYDLGDAFLKRDAFKHEEEVRIITANRDNFIENPIDNNLSNLKFEIDLNDFIEDIILDPRTTNHNCEAIKKYCLRSGINIIPKKSDLYEYNIRKKTNLVKKITDNDEEIETIKRK